ncbi:MAG: hypothetical protein L6R37_002447 [Teloschistes peruensis]|nr:MAG: hypothetical protein L6R37_002447 [Teloschistes peruensis]
MSPHAIIDSHIHLYPRAELHSLSWCKEGHQLYGQHAVKEYLEASRHLDGAPDQELQGFIFVETDRKSHIRDEVGWDEPLRELDWIKRVADGTPRPGEGHETQHSRLCLAIVLWAPVPSGAEAMQTFTQKASVRAGSTWKCVKGFRYLVQDKPRGTMLSDGFVEALRWMGHHNYAFDLGVDTRSGGYWQLDEAVEMISRAHEGLSEDQRVTIVISKHSLSHPVLPRQREQSSPVIDHMGKPDMRSRNTAGNPDAGTFDDWKAGMTKLASFEKTYVKISGAFSEMDALPSQAEQGEQDSLKRQKLLQGTLMWVERWLREILTIFGPERVMFGSDWPVCNVGGGGNDVSSMNWWSVVDEFLRHHLNAEDQARLWSGNAVKAYGLDPLDISPPT